MQVANYPSQLHAPSSADLRKKAHVDSGTLTLLASQDWLAGSNWSVGDGGLQLLSAQGDWREVQVPQGEHQAIRTSKTCMLQAVTSCL
jgi:isopenicillin N synthase-like dioxygenase